MLVKKEKKIRIPQNIQLYLNEEALIVVNAQKKILVKLPKFIKLSKTKNILIIGLLSLEEIAKFGSWVSKLKNLMLGLSKLYTISLSLKGLGFKAKTRENKLQLKLGYSHIVKYKLNNEVKVQISKKTNLRLSSYSKQIITDQAAKICKLRKPDSYKGKGIIFRGQKLKLKVGKKA
jgi:large subunit ribosomal protein L6